MSEQTENVVAVKALEEMATYTAAITAAALSLVTGGFEAWLDSHTMGYVLHYTPQGYSQSVLLQPKYPYEQPVDDLAANLEDAWYRGQFFYHPNVLGQLHTLAREYFEARLTELVEAPAWPRTNTAEVKEAERAWAQEALAKLLADPKPPDVKPKPMQEAA